MDPSQTNIPETPPTSPAPSPLNSDRKVKLIEKLLELDLGLHMFVGALLLFLAFFVVAWRFDLVGFFQGQSEIKNDLSNTKPQPIIADATSQDPLFINEHKVSIEKAFKTEASKLKLTVSGQLKKEVFGFLPYWALEESDKIDIRLLTTVSYFGLDVDGSGNIMRFGADGKTLEGYEAWQDSEKLNTFINRAKRNRTKVHITIKNFDNGNIERLVTSQQASQNFINNALYLMNSKSLDGINIDFEYVGTPPQKVVDGFSLLIADLNKELKRQYPKSKLTVCTYIDAASHSRLFDVAILAQNSDALVIMGYDFHTPNSSSAGPVAPMEGYGNSMIGFMSSYLEKVPADKLILAVPYYGYDWPTNGSGQNASTTGGQAKAIPYAEILEATKRTQINWDENAQTPWYSYKDEAGVTRVVHFENERSLGIKYDFINNKNLQGVGIWALGFDGLRTELLQLLADKFAN
jgi:spore germination protein